MATKYKSNSERLAEFMSRYPLADTKTMYMFLRGRGSKNPFAKNALTLGAGTVRSMVSAGKLSSRKDRLYNLTKREADRYFDIEPYYKVNGNEETRKRIAKVSYIASVLIVCIKAERHFSTCITTF